VCFENLRKVSAYLLPAGSFSEVLPVILNVFIGIPLGLAPIPMLIICCITDVIASMALVLEEPEVDIMLKPPRSLENDHMLDLRLLGNIYVLLGSFQSLAAWINWMWYMTTQGFQLNAMFFAWGWGNDGYGGQSAANQAIILQNAQSVFFVTLVVIQAGNLLSTRRRNMPYFYTPPGVLMTNEPVSNKVGHIDGGVTNSSNNQNEDPHTSAKWANLHTVLRIIGVITINMAVLVLCTECSGLANLISTGPVPGQHWGYAFGVSALIFLLCEGKKWIVVLNPENRFAKYFSW